MFGNNKKNIVEDAIIQSCNTNELVLKDIGLTTLPRLLKNLVHVKTVHLENNKLTEIDCSELPKCVEQLFLSNNNLKKIDLSNAPFTLKTVYVNNNKLTELITKDSSVEFLFANNNNLKEVDELGKSLKVLQCQKNSITKFIDLGYIEQLSCSYNNIKTFTGVESLRSLNISNNPLEEIKNMSKRCSVIVLKSTKLKKSEKIDKNIIFADHLTGISHKLVNELKGYYATVLQSRVRGMIVRKQYQQLKVIRDLNDLNNLPKNFNPKILGSYLLKPKSKIAIRYMLKN